LLARPVAAFFRVLVLRFFAMRPSHLNHRSAVAASAARSRTCRNSAGFSHVPVSSRKPSMKNVGVPLTPLRTAT
jgi:hypothetical protein